MKKVLTIAGSDSGGGAGIQADLKTFQALGVYGGSAITAVTAQNTKGVAGIFPLPAKFVALQIDAVMNEGKVDTWKTGMLVNREIVEVVAKKATKYKVKRLVLDPVMVAGSGRRLLAKNALETLKKVLLPLAYVVTPNISEAEVLTGRKITSIDDMKEAAVLLHKLGATYIVVKGGHFYGNQESGLAPSLGPRGIRNQGRKTHYSPFIIPNSRSNVVDILFDGRLFHEFRSPRIKTRNTHGTGCTFASAIAAELAKGKTVLQAVKPAKAYVYQLYFVGYLRNGAA